ncbi:MAG TPA: endonuclease [Anaerolineaceae bacterium]|nr:endonuclease [Anaerolineaceae bacterium]
MNKVRVVVSGLGWLGSGTGSIESAIEDLLRNARKEILLTVYSIGQADRIFDLLDAALSRGVKVQMVVNRLSKQHAMVLKRLEELRKKYPYFSLFSFDPQEERGDLHAKVMVVDRSRALVGSSNLSYNGMVTNLEMAALIEGKEAENIADLIAKVISGLS